MKNKELQKLQKFITAIEQNKLGIDDFFVSNLKSVFEDLGPDSTEDFVTGNGYASIEEFVDNLRDDKKLISMLKVPPLLPTVSEIFFEFIDDREEYIGLYRDCCNANMLKTKIKLHRCNPNTYLVDIKFNNHQFLFKLSILTFSNPELNGTQTTISCGLSPKSCIFSNFNISGIEYSEMNVEKNKIALINNPRTSPLFLEFLYFIKEDLFKSPNSVSSQHMDVDFFIDMDTTKALEDEMHSFFTTSLEDSTSREIYGLIGIPIIEKFLLEKNISKKNIKEKNIIKI